MSDSNINILLVDDNAPWRRQICAMLQPLADMRVMGEAADGLEAVAAAEKLQPDLVLLDLNFPGLDGIEAARRILKVSPRSKILFMSLHTSPDVVQLAFDSGAHGFLEKMEAGENLLTAVRGIMRGEKFVSKGLEDSIS